VEPGHGIAHILAQADLVGRTILVILVVMSAVSWYLILLKVLQNALEARAVRRFQHAFRAVAVPSQLATLVQGASFGDAFSRIATEGLAAADHVRNHGPRNLPDTGAGELVARTLRQAVLREGARREYGLTLLAATASSAPFIGLFGTVWGIYQALVQIGMSGQGTLDKVAGPVGEALVMTAAGLAVAIPAVLAYNFFVRANRTATAAFSAFSHTLFVLIATGARADADASQGAAAAMHAVTAPTGSA
jgi:biopolymer transport protein ExbB